MPESLSNLQSRFRQEVTVRLLRDRYLALARLREGVADGDWLPARMLGRPALVVRGEAGARTFYDPELVTRHGAVPAPVRLVLFGPGAVHGLKGQLHSNRKRIFLDLIDPETARALGTAVSRGLSRAAASWLAQGTIVLFDELVQVYGAAALDWAGTGTGTADARTVSKDLATMVDGFGLGGSAYLRAASARLRAQRWALRVIKEAREGDRTPSAGSAVAVLAATPRSQLPDLVAATELLNIVRPTVAVAYFGAYAAQALALRPDWRADLAAGSPEHLRAFEHEIRRWYPFAPLLTGRLEKAYDCGGRRYRAGDWMVLDVLGTNRDPRSWDRPDDFAPERFLGREPTPFDYVPHGGGDPATGHRCPGEPLAISILGETIQQLARLDYSLASSGHDVPMGRIPSLPPDRLTLHDLRAADELDEAQRGHPAGGVGAFPAANP